MDTEAAAAAAECSPSRFWLLPGKGWMVAAASWDLASKTVFI